MSIIHSHLLRLPHPRCSQPPRLRPLRQGLHFFVFSKLTVEPKPNDFSLFPRLDLLDLHSIPLSPLIQRHLTGFAYILAETFVVSPQPPWALSSSRAPPSTLTSPTIQDLAGVPASSPPLNCRFNPTHTHRRSLRLRPKPFTSSPLRPPSFSPSTVDALLFSSSPVCVRRFHSTVDGYMSIYAPDRHSKSGRPL